MPTFLALYRGQTVADARLVAVSADPQLVATVAAALLQQRHGEQGGDDAALASLARGRRGALRVIAREARQ